MTQNNHVVIMAGGVGSRFWPLSTPEFPKQFIDILGVGRTLIQLTFDRFAGIAPAQNIWVVTNASYVEIVRQQLPDIPAENILAEPAARNTAPCIAWACWCIKQKDPSANVVVTPSDAIVMNTIEFQRVINNSLAFTAQKDAIVTIGITPTRPETGYGYVQASNDTNPSFRDSSNPSNPSFRDSSHPSNPSNPCSLDPSAHNSLCKDNPSNPCSEIRLVSAFKEKPNRETAEEYLRAGNYLWNAGIFVWNVNTIAAALTKYKPNIAQDMDDIITTGNVEQVFPNCEKISIDFAVMEPAAADGCVYTHPASFGWSDLGNWQSLHEKLQKDADNNGTVGNVHLYECNNCVVHTEDAKKVVLQGLDGYIVSEKGGQILVCKRSEEQRIKEWNS